MTTSTPGLAVLDTLGAPQSPVIGHTVRGPVFLAQGGRGGGGIDFIVGDDDGDDPEFDDEDSDEEDDEDERPRSRRQRDDDDESGRDDDANWRPLTREAQEAMETALQRANREAMNRRKAGKILDKIGVHDAAGFEEFLRSRGIDPDTGQRLDDDDDSAVDELAETQNRLSDSNGRKAAVVDKARYEREKTRAEQRGAARAEAKYQGATTLLAAENALRNAGWHGENLNLALKLIDPDRVEVSFDDAGDLSVDGLEEQIEEIKAEFPSWFRPTSRDRSNITARRREAGARQVDGGNRDKAPPRKQGWADRLSRQIEQGR